MLLKPPTNPQISISVRCSTLKNEWGAWPLSPSVHKLQGKKQKHQCAGVTQRHKSRPALEGTHWRTRTHKVSFHLLLFESYRSAFSSADLSPDGRRGPCKAWPWRGMSESGILATSHAPVPIKREGWVLRDTEAARPADVGCSGVRWAERLSLNKS